MNIQDGSDGSLEEFIAHLGLIDKIGGDMVETQRHLQLQRIIDGPGVLDHQ